MIDMKVAEELGSIISSMARSASRQSESIAYATVVSAKQGDMWVSIDGGAVRTPVWSSTCSVAQGDRVIVRLADGKCSIIGNMSRVAANQGDVDMTVLPVKRAAADANDLASIANTAASAVGDQVNGYDVVLPDGTIEHKTGIIEDINDLDSSIFGEDGAMESIRGDLDDLGNSLNGYDVVQPDGSIVHIDGALDDLDRNIADSRKDAEDAISDLRKQLKASEDRLKLVEEANKGLSDSITLANSGLSDVQKYVSELKGWYKIENGSLQMGSTSAEDITTLMILSTAILGWYVKRGDSIDADPVASIVPGDSPTGSLLSIGNAKILMNLWFGGFRWTSRGNGNMSLMWAGDE